MQPKPTMVAEGCVLHGCSVSEIECADAVRCIAFADRRPGRDRLVDCGQLILAQDDIGSGNVLFEVADLLGAWDGDDVVALRQDPGKGELTRRAALGGRDRADLADELEVVVEGCPLEPRRRAPPVIRVQVVERCDLPGQDTSGAGRGNSPRCRI